MTPEYSVNLRRFLAFFLDLLAVVTLGAIADVLFHRQLSELGPKAYLAGFAIALLYHALSNAFVGQGQTVGKMITGLKVVTKTGARIGLLRSLGRSLLIIPPFFESVVNLLHGALGEVVGAVQVVFSVGLLYFLLAAPMFRTMHDFIFGTYVVDARARTIQPSRFPLKHGAAIVGISVVFIVTLNYMFSGFPTFDALRSPMASLDATRQDILALPDVQDASASFEPGRVVSINVQTAREPLDGRRLGAEAYRMLDRHFNLEDSKIHVVVMRGYDMVIYHSWETYENTLRAREWEEVYAESHRSDGKSGMEGEQQPAMTGTR